MTDQKSIILEARSVSYTYKGKTKKQALTDISLQLYKGEVLAIVGASGSGKSTLLRLLAGYLDVSAGEILLKDKRLRGPADVLVPGHKDIGLVFQDFQLLTHHTAYENIEYRMRKFDDEYKNYRINLLVDLLGMKGFLNQTPLELSGGQHQRLAVACALASEPDVLLLDEPFSHLDSGARQRLANDLLLVKNQTNTAIAMVTHDIQDAFMLADRVIVIDQGKCIAEGTPASLYQQPTYQSIASLTGRYNAVETSKLKQVCADITLEGDMLCIRPEDIVINENSQGNFFVEQARFWGAGMRYWLRNDALDITLEMYAQDLHLEINQSVDVIVKQASVLQA